MSEDPRFERLEQRAYEKLFGPDSGVGVVATRMVGFESDLLVEMARDAAHRNLISSLVEEGESETLAMMAVESAFERRRQEALEGKLDYTSWLSAVALSLDRSGILVWALCVVAAIVAVAVMYGLSQTVPAGQRLKISYLMAAILAGGGAFILGSIPVYYWLRKEASSSSGNSKEA